MRECYFQGIFECLSEDLLEVKAHPEVRVLLSEDTLRFAEAEVEVLRRLGREHLPETPVAAQFRDFDRDGTVDARLVEEQVAVILGWRAI